MPRTPDTPIFEHDLAPSVRFKDGYRPTAKQVEALEDLMHNLVVDVPYMIPGLGCYDVTLPLGREPRSSGAHAALRFVAQVQQDPDVEDFAADLEEVARAHFEVEEPPAGVVPNDVGNSRMLLRVVDGDLLGYGE